jgi:hypothetical protein
MVTPYNPSKWDWDELIASQDGEHVEYVFVQQIEPHEAVSAISGSLDQIAGVLNGQEWGPDTCDAIAAILRASGRVVGDVVGGAA